MSRTRILKPFMLAAALPGILRAQHAEHAAGIQAIDEAKASMAERVAAAEARDLAAKFKAALDEPREPYVAPKLRPLLAIPALHASSKTRRPGENRAQHRARRAKENVNGR